jgi:hypothetical protein
MRIHTNGGKEDDSAPIAGESHVHAFKLTSFEEPGPPDRFVCRIEQEIPGALLQGDLDQLPVPKPLQLPFHIIIVSHVIRHFTLEDDLATDGHGEKFFLEGYVHIFPPVTGLDRDADDALSHVLRPIRSCTMCLGFRVQARGA